MDGSNDSYSEQFCNNKEHFVRRMKNEGLKIMHHNLQGFLSKSDELQMFLNGDGQDLSVISLNEHKLQQTNVNLLQKLKGFKLGSYCARDSSYGGSCLLVKSHLKFKVRDDLQVLNEDFIFEGSYIELTDLNIIVASIYTSSVLTSHNPFLSKLTELLSKIWKDKITRVIICTDCNIDVLKITHASTALIERLESFGYRKNFSSPTRVSRTSNTCIDNIITSINCIIKDSFTFDMGYSDHRALYLILSNMTQQTL
jgi:exonuclease III